MEQLELFDLAPDFRSHKKFKNRIFREKAELELELRQQGRDEIVYVLSFGGGTQSAHLLEQHLQGRIHYDYIIFSDTGAEPQFIHEQVEWWRARQRSFGNKTPFIIARHSIMKGGLEEMLMRWILTDYQRFQMPVYCSTLDQQTGEIKPAGMMPRQCTVDFKIIPVKQAARRMVMEKLGLEYRQKMPDHIGFIIDIGFSYDEIRRINTDQSPQFKYMRLAYPLVEENLTTSDSIRFLEENNFPMRRSRCYLCPFNCDGARDIGMDWEEIIESEPLSFLKACWFDDKLREVQKTGTKIMRSIPYLHYSRQPLKEVYPSDYTRIREANGIELEEWAIEWTACIKENHGLR
ncbi:hypothetical protein FRY98_24695 [Paenibacillus faecis]|uniref:Phosphoadenosine phosphosulfate reductase family protein n=1 Tax=Paenibacillus faecis TaxID=862114 RepID=A0A5D0CM90_9BACL|nr:hypothetical protein [Paenibacillus faecis]TYA10968.1 hypothetical protein FRY98_24695 [Paenibacillus faecis]